MLSDYIDELNLLMFAKGDRPIVKHDVHGPMAAYREISDIKWIIPKLENRREKRKRETTHKVWHELFDKDMPKGEEVYVL
jgi:hypothetical protein